MNFPKRYVVLAILLGGTVWAAVGVTGYLRLSSDTMALRQSFLSSTAGRWDKKVAVHVGWFTMAFAHLGGRFIHMPPEAHAALQSVRGAEVGVYKLQGEFVPLDGPTIFAQSDKEMGRRGWERVVGVEMDRDLVAVYFPKGKVSVHGLRCCVLVSHDRDLVVASAKGDLEPLMGIVREKLGDHWEQRLFAGNF
jgi:hypothetical protein